MKLPSIGNIFRPAPNVNRSIQSGVPSASTSGIYKPFAGLPSAPPKPGTSPAVQRFREVALQSNASVKLPSRSYPTPKTFGEVTQNIMTADRLVKAGVFKTGPDLKTVTRDAFVNAGVNGLVSTPLSIGTYAGSVWSGEQIKGAFTANTPLLPPAHQPAPSQQSTTAGMTPTTPSQKEVELRLENMELKLLLVANSIQAYIEGEDGRAWDKSPDWPTETNARIDMLEKLYDASEKNLELIARKNKFIFEPYKDESVTPKKDPVGRLEVLELRNELILKEFARINTVLDPNGPPPSTHVI